MEPVQFALKYAARGGRWFICWENGIDLGIHEKRKQKPGDSGKGEEGRQSALTDSLFPASGRESPPTSEKDERLRRAEAWASGEQWAAPAAPTQAPDVFVGDASGGDYTKIRPISNLQHVSGV